MGFNGSLAKWNKSKSNDTLVDNEQMSRIRQRNSLDLQLYDYALSLFEERIKFVPPLKELTGDQLDYSEDDVDENEYEN